MGSRYAIALGVLVAGCSDYGIGNKPVEGTPGADSGDLTVAPPDSDLPEPICPQLDLAWAWTGSPAILVEADPVDGAGAPFWDPAYVETGWTPAPLPDRSAATGADRAYRATFKLDAIPGAVQVDLQSDDGIWLWVNGAPIGHWGGAWQEEGCVNEDADCLVTVDVPPVDLTPWLAVGPNTIAGRVSNPVANGFFDVIPSCVE